VILFLRAFALRSAARFDRGQPLHGAFEVGKDAGVALALCGVEVFRLLLFHHGELVLELAEDAHDHVIHFVGVDVGGGEVFGDFERAHGCIRGPRPLGRE
jgi:hypothetical protein